MDTITWINGNPKIYRVVKHIHLNRLALYEIQCWSGIKQCWYTMYSDNQWDKIVSYCSLYSIPALDNQVECHNPN